jgi:hypothetical protein
MKRKGQEEIMGFVIIVVIVVVIAVVFLGFSLHKKTKSIEPQQMQIEDLLQSMLIYTTDCEVNNEMLSVRELIRECNQDSSKGCLDNQLVCNKLNSTFNHILKDTLGQSVGAVEDAFVHGYSLEINASEYMLIETGELSGNYFSAYVPVPINAYVGEAELTLKCYYA